MTTEKCSAMRIMEGYGSNLHARANRSASLDARVGAKVAEVETRVGVRRAGCGGQRVLRVGRVTLVAALGVRLVRRVGRLRNLAGRVGCAEVGVVCAKSALIAREMRNVQYSFPPALSL